LTASARRESRDRSLRTVPAPLGEMRRIQTFSTEKNAELTRRLAPVRFLENPQLIARRELTPTGAFDHFRVGYWRSRLGLGWDGVHHAIG